MIVVTLLSCLLLGPDTLKAEDVPDNTLLILKYAVDDVIDNFEKNIPNELSLPDLNIQDGTIVLKGGKITNLKSLKRTGEVETEKLVDGYSFLVEYTLGSIGVLYDNFKYKYGWFSKEGKLTSSFKNDNMLKMELRMPTLSKAMEEYGKGKCFIYVESFDMKSPKLTIDRVYTGGLTGGRTTTWALPKVSKGLEGAVQKGVGQALQEQITTFMTAKAKNSICVTPDKQD